MRSTAPTPSDLAAGAAGPRARASFFRGTFRDEGGVGVERQHRAIHRFPIDRRAAAAGLLLAGLIVAAAFAGTHRVYDAEAGALGALLRLGDTPYVQTPAAASGPLHGGAVFTVPAEPSPVPPAAAGAGIAAFAVATAATLRSRRVPVPVKVIWLLFAAVGTATLVWTGFVSGTPPRPPNTLGLGFQRSGLLAVVVGSVLFAFEVFPLPGPLRVKAGWLAVLACCALGWSVVRMAFVLATVHHVGSWTFLYLQYVAGPVVDFLWIVAVYSLATHSLARRLPRREVTA